MIVKKPIKLYPLYLRPIPNALQLTKRMCGIFGYSSTKLQKTSVVFQGLQALDYRGYDSWGIAWAHNGTVSLVKNIGQLPKFSPQLPPTTFAFGHTRWATHGGVTVENAHPHLDCTKTVAVVHNGIVENYEELKKNLIKKKHIFISNTDTEIIPHLIEELSLKQNFTQAVRSAFKALEGLNALIVMDTQTKQLIGIRNGSPLVVGLGKNIYFIASDPLALLPHTKTAYFLKDFEMAVLKGNSIQFFNVHTSKKIIPKLQKLNWNLTQTKKGKFKHFMLKEIHEQPRIIADIATSGNPYAKKLARMINNAYGTYLIACGSAAYVGLAGTYIFSKISTNHVNYCVGSEFGYQQDFLTPKSLVIALSQSGETIDTLEAVRRAKVKGAKIAALVNVVGSSLYREADYMVPLGAGPERAVASTKALTAKLAYLLLVAYSLRNEQQTGQELLQQAYLSAKQVLSTNTVDRIKNLVSKIKNKKHIYVIGRGLSFSAALETALKIKEISYIHAEGLDAGELKHGPIALIEQDTPCIAFLPNDETYGANLAGAMEMKARGGFIIGISYKPHEVFDYYIPVKDAKEATVIPNIITGQLIAYHLAVERSLDPDKPRNLAKSVTVK